MLQGLFPDPKLGRSPLCCPSAFRPTVDCSIIPLKTSYGKLGSLLTLAGLRGPQRMVKAGRQVDGINLMPFPPMWAQKNSRKWRSCNLVGEHKAMWPADTFS